MALVPVLFSLGVSLYSRILSKILNSAIILLSCNMVQKIHFRSNLIFIPALESHKIKFLHHCMEYLKISSAKTTKNAILFRMILNYAFFDTFINICLRILIIQCIFTSDY